MKWMILLALVLLAGCLDDPAPYDYTKGRITIKVSDQFGKAIPDATIVATKATNEDTKVTASTGVEGWVPMDFTRATRDAVMYNFVVSKPYCIPATKTLNPFHVGVIEPFKLFCGELTELEIVDHKGDPANVKVQVLVVYNTSDEDETSQYFDLHYETITDAEGKALIRTVPIASIPEPAIAEAVSEYGGYAVKVISSEYDCAEMYNITASPPEEPLHIGMWCGMMYEQRKQQEEYAKQL